MTPVEEIYRKAIALADEGLYAEALREYLWCFDFGGELDPAFVGVRSSFLLGHIRRMGEVYPAAIEALQERRSTAIGEILRGPESMEAAWDAVALSRSIGDDFDFVAVLKGMGEGAARPVVLEAAIEELAERREYEFAVRCGAEAMGMGVSPATGRGDRSDWRVGEFTVEGNECEAG